MNQHITYTPPCNKTSIELDILAKIKVHLRYIDKLYIREEREIFKPPEFILIYLNHQHQLPQKFQAVHYQKLPHFFHIASQIYPQTTKVPPPHHSKSEKTLLIPQTPQKDHHIGQHTHIHKVNRT